MFFSTASADFLHRGTLTQIPAVSQACFKRKLGHLKAPQKSGGQKVGQTCGVKILAWKVNMGVSKNRGTPKMDGLQWNTLLLLNMDDLGGPPLFLVQHPYAFNIQPAKLHGSIQDEWLWYRIHQGFSDMKEPSRSNICTGLLNPSLDSDVPREYGQTQI